MTVTEIMAIGGGLLLGYWLVSVFLPNLLHKNSDTDPRPYRPTTHQESDFQNEEPLKQEQTTSFEPEPPGSAWFEILEVDESASDQEIQTAYKRQISQYHPDKVARMGIDIRRLAEAKSMAINAAYEKAMARR